MELRKGASQAMQGNWSTLGVTRVEADGSGGEGHTSRWLEGEKRGKDCFIMYSRPLAENFTNRYLVVHRGRSVKSVLLLELPDRVTPQTLCWRGLNTTTRFRRR